MVLFFLGKAEHSRHSKVGENQRRGEKWETRKLVCCVEQLHTFRPMGQGKHTILQVQEAGLTDILQFTASLANFSLLETHADPGAPTKHCERPGTDLEHKIKPQSVNGPDLDNQSRRFNKRIPESRVQKRSQQSSSLNTI